MIDIKKLFLLALLCVTYLLATTNIRAEILASDNFTQSSGTNLAVMINTESLGVGTYSVIQGSPTTNMSITNITGFGSGNILRWGGGGQTYYRPFNGDTTFSLSNLATGEVLRLSFDVRFAGNLVSADNFSFGFVGNAQTTNSIVYTTLDLNGTNAATLQSEFRYRPASFNMSDAGTSIIIGNSFAEPVTATSNGYVMKFEVTRMTNGFLIDYYRDAVLVGTRTGLTASAWVSTMSTSTISGIAFRGIDFVTTYIDNLEVERTMMDTPSDPEPVGSTNTFITVSSGLIQFDFDIATGAVYRVETSTNLIDGTGWTNITDSLTNQTGPSLTFTDTNSVAYPARNYRIVSP